MQAARSRISRHYQASPDRPMPIVRLWLLRLLVPLDAQREVMGKRGFLDAGVARALGVEHWGETMIDEFDQSAFLAELRRLHGAAERSACKARVPQRLRHNVERLSHLVGFDDVSCRIIEFAVMLENERLLGDTTEYLGTLTSLKVFHALSVLLGLPPATVRRALEAQGKLAQSGLLALTKTTAGSLRHKLGFLSDRLADRLASTSMDPIGLLRETILPSEPGHLTLHDFPHLAPSLALLRPYLFKALAGHRRGVNILLYGRPGTGKSQLGKALAADLNCKLYEISGEDDDGDPISGGARLRAYRAAQFVLSTSPAMILFDEVEDVFDAPYADDGHGAEASRGHKAWINRTLEGNPVPAIWLTNSISGIDAAFLRRFDMVLELPIPPRRQRAKILRDACGDILDATAVSRLSECEVLAPAVVARAASVVRLARDDLAGVTPTHAITTLIDQTLRAQSRVGLQRTGSLHMTDIYDLAFVNAGADLHSVAQGLIANGTGRICLYGPPGTGKTAWARWLAAQADRPLLVRRASDLLSKWLGDNERNVAEAFRAATSNGAVLLIDEVDSFLQDRRDATRIWETTLVNEMLTQMEEFDGLFLASTNLMDRLDPASLRRFDLKLRFDYLRHDQSAALLERYLGKMTLPAADVQSLKRLEQLTSLTPGDFATVGRQHGVRPFASADAVVSQLEAEAAWNRHGLARRIGFV